MTGLARDVADVVLQRRTEAGGWVQVARIAPTTDGTFALRVRVATTTAFRLTAGGVAGPTLAFRIAA